MKIKVIVILILLFSAFVITANLAGFHLYPSFYDYKPKLGGQNYEALVTSEKLGGFAQSKPPGQVLFYVLYFLVLFLLAAGSLAAAVLVDLDEIQWANIKIVIPLVVFAIPAIELAFLPPIFFLKGLIQRSSKKSQRCFTPQFGMLTALSVTLIYLAFFSHTVAEIARLWIFLIPVVCFIAARNIQIFKNRQGAVFTMVCLLQFALVFAIKVTHDF